MANTKSAKKNVRKNDRRYKINLARKSEVKTVLKKVMSAIASGENLQTVKDLMREAESEISKAKNKIYHSNTASRKVSRLAKRVAKYEQEKSASK
jgi:small subunit ribosomal protein S20